MNFNLLAGSAIGLFIGMLIIMIVVMLLFGFLTFLIFKQRKKPIDSANVYSVKRMLSRRETQITIEIMNNKDDEAKKAELINKLRRVRSAVALVEELLEEEKAISGITDPEEENDKPKRPHPQGKNGQHPVRKPAGEKQPSGGQPEGQPAKKAPSEQPVVKSGVQQKKPEKKKKDDMEFKPSED